METTNTTTHSSSEYQQGRADGIADWLRGIGGRMLPMNAAYREGYADGFNAMLARDAAAR